MIHKYFYREKQHIDQEIRKEETSAGSKNAQQPFYISEKRFLRLVLTTDDTFDSYT